MVTRPSTPGATVAVAAALALPLVAAAAPIGVVIGAARLVALATMAVGTWLLVARAGAVELGAGAMAGAGAVAGGVLASRWHVDVALLLPLAALAGGAVGSVAGALHGRLGRHLGAVTSLTLGVVAVAAWRGTGSLGGRAGFHGVPFLAGTDRTSLVVAGVVLVVAVVVAARVAPSRLAARAAVAAGAPPVAEVLGGGAMHTALLGAVAGAIVGVGGALSSAVGGSAVADAHGPALGVLLALAAVVGRASPVAAVAGVLVLWGPGIVWPLAPVVGTASPWLTTGIASLVWLVLRRDRTDLPLPQPDTQPDPQPDTAPPTTREPRSAAPPVPRLGRAALDVDGVTLPADVVDLAARPGEVTVVTGPNGAGKSTLLAVLGGQRPGPSVRLGDDLLPPTPLGRSHLGVARTWQRPPDVRPDDLLQAAVSDRDADSGYAAEWALRVLGDPPEGPDAVRAHASLVALAARRPRAALLDEPAAYLPAAPVAGLLRGLADGGAAVVVVEHRPEIIAVADREVAVARATVAHAGDDTHATPVTVRHPTGALELDAGAGSTRVDPASVVEVTAEQVAVLRGAAPGRSRWRGSDVARWDPDRQVRAGLVVLGDAPVAPEVSVVDHLAVLIGDDAARRLLETTPLLAGRGADPAGWLSGGERQALSWLQGVAAGPAAVVLDGAGRGMDLEVLAWAGAIVRGWVSAGACVAVRPGRGEERAWLARDGD